MAGLCYHIFAMFSKKTNKHIFTIYFQSQAFTRFSQFVVCLKVQYINNVTQNKLSQSLAFSAVFLYKDRTWFPKFLANPEFINTCILIKKYKQKYHSSETWKFLRIFQTGTYLVLKIVALWWIETLIFNMIDVVASILILFNAECQLEILSEF